MNQKYRLVRALLILLVFVVVSFAGGAAWQKTKKAARTHPASLEMDARAVSPTRELPLQELETVRLFERSSVSVVYITSLAVQRDHVTRRLDEIPRGSGSGFIWDNMGHVVTNYHVVRGADGVRVTLSDHSSWPAVLVGSAPEKDLAVLHIDAPPELMFPIDIGRSSDLKVGQLVLAIGNPFGLDQTLTTGIVSALGREIESMAGIPIRNAIQTDAAINPGNSGGPLLDSAGRLIGVNTSIISPSGAFAGIGFAIPVDAVAWVVPELIKNGRIMRPVLGVELAPEQVLQRLNLEGALVLDVTPGGPAQKAGIHSTRRDESGALVLGDIILALDDRAIQSPAEVIYALERRQPGEKIRLSILRDKIAMDVELVLDPPQ